MSPTPDATRADCLLVQCGRHAMLLPASGIGPVRPLLAVPPPLPPGHRRRPLTVDLRRLLGEPAAEPPVALDWSDDAAAAILLASSVERLVTPWPETLRPLPPGLAHLRPFCDAIWLGDGGGALVLRLRRRLGVLDRGWMRRLRRAAAETPA